MQNSSCCDILYVLSASVPQDLSALQCEVCVLVFSVTDRRSFHRTAQLRLLLRETQPQTPIILVGNKSDLVRTREVTSQGEPKFQLLFSSYSLSSHLFYGLFPPGSLPSPTVLVFSALFLSVNSIVNVKFMPHRCVGVWRVPQLQLQLKRIHCDCVASPHSYSVIAYRLSNRACMWYSPRPH